MASGISVTLDDVRHAQSAIGEFINRSPCVLSARLSDHTGCMLHLKMENLQRTGAYKDRGAMNAVLSLDAADKSAGVIAAKVSWKAM